MSGGIEERSMEREVRVALEVGLADGEAGGESF